MYEPENVDAVDVGPSRRWTRFVDVGTHVGFFFVARRVARRQTTGRVHLVRARGAPTSRHLGDHVRAQPLRERRARERRGRRDGRSSRSFWVNADNDGGHALWNVGDHPYKPDQPPEREQASGGSGHDARPAARDIAGGARPKLIKIDVEGSGAERASRREIVARATCAIRPCVRSITSRSSGWGHDPRTSSALTCPRMATKRTFLHPETGEIIPLRPDSARRLGQRLQFAVFVTPPRRSSALPPRSSLPD